MQFQKATEFILNKLALELPGYLHYHSAGHTYDVYAAAKLLAESEQIDPYQSEWILTAACYHDAGYLTHTLGHEEESCRIAKEVLAGFDYNPAGIDSICGMIMATRIPQNPQNHFEQILADADLDYLGRDDFFAISHKLYLELLHLGRVSDATEWDRMQIEFMESHHYFTKTAINLRGNKKRSNLEQIKARLLKATAL
ncbi:MAG: HD domain-containing protein [Daejeonella sp.]